MTDEPRKRERATDLEDLGPAPRAREPKGGPEETPPKPAEGAGDVSRPGRDPAGAPGAEASTEARPQSDKAPGRPRRRRSRRAPQRSAEGAAAGTAPSGDTSGAPPESTDPREGPSRSSQQRGRSRGRGRKPRKPRPEVERFMLVHGDAKGTQIAVLEAGEIVEHYVTRHDDRSLVGSVYLGRVQNVLPGMEASFIDIGESRNGVLYAGEVGIAGDEGDEVPRIETVLRSGQPILVQVTKDPMGAKGARLTANVSLAGRHLVLVPNGRSLGVSRRLPDGERDRLRRIGQSLETGDHGLIIRTAAEGASERDLERDLARLLEQWSEIDTRSRSAKAPALIYSEPELELRVIRDIFNRDVNRCVVDDPELESKLRTYVRNTTPDLDHRLELYRGELPIFEEYRVLEQIRKSLDRKVWLRSGGHIVIDRTEALTVVDVNTGRFVGKKSLEETVYKTNVEAAGEVARQLRLRDIGGIIVVDFIDMEDASNREGLIKTFRDALDADRTRTQVFDISPLGLVQMTRKNVSQGIVEAFSDPCPTCEGRGILLHDVD